MSVLDLSKGKILGAPEVSEGYILMNVKCQCGTTSLLIGLPGPASARPCSNPECDMDFAITGPPVFVDGQWNWSVGFRRRIKP